MKSIGKSLALGVISFLCFNLILGQNLTFAFISAITFLTFIDLLKSLGKTIPIVELTVFLMAVQMLYTPALEFYFYPNFLDTNEWKTLMIGEADQYFQFTLPATIFFILGIYFPYKRKVSSKILITGFEKLKLRKGKLEKIGIGLIIIGISCTFLESYLNIGAINFILLLLSYFKFIGLFYLVAIKSRHRNLSIIIIMIPFILSTFIGSVFINLVIWSFFLGSYLILGKKFTMSFKIIGFAALLFAGTIIQVTKHQYREIVWLNKGQMEGTKLETFGKLIIDQVNSIDGNTFIMSFATLTSRLNQGIILSYVLDNIPDRRPFADGRFFYNELLGIALPRFIFPNKPVVGDRNKFEYMAGWRLSSKTMMNVGILGDGYGNFRYLGGIFFCFSFGLFISLLLKRVTKWSINRPTLLLWLPLIFFYAMRAGNEFYIIANWMVKVSVLVLFYFFIFERGKFISRRRATKPQSF